MLYVNARSQVNKREYKKKTKQNKNPHAQFGKTYFEFFIRKDEKIRIERNLYWFLAATVVIIYACTLWGKKRINKINNIKPF